MRSRLLHLFLQLQVCGVLVDGFVQLLYQAGLVFYLFVEAVDFLVVGINLRVQECIFFVGGVQLCV